MANGHIPIRPKSQLDCRNNPQFFKPKKSIMSPKKSIETPNTGLMVKSARVSPQKPNKAFKITTARFE